MKTLLALSLLATLPLHAGENPAKKEVRVVEEVVTVGGHVRRPGPVKYTKGDTLYAVIQAAGGATEFGAMNRVKVIRSGKTTAYDLRKDKLKLTVVQADDVIEIPQKNIIGK